MEIAQALCDRIAIIDRGRIITHGTFEQLRDLHGNETLEEVFLSVTGRGSDALAAEMFK